ncbi:hypothetical protein ES703_13305 [subsurface metagenome]
MKRELWYSVVVRDRHGKVVSRERRKSRSFLKAWNQLLYVNMSRVPQLVKDTGGVDRGISGNQYFFGMDTYQSPGFTDYGTRIGTGNTAVAIDDYALKTPIEEGTGVGEMNHLLCNIATYVVAPPSCYFIVSRSIVNNSAAEITVREAGLYAVMASQPQYWCCVTRDVFGTPQAVPIGGTITVNWTIKVTV